MSQIQNGYHWTSGEICTAAHLNQMVESATLNSEVITGQDVATSVNLGDTFLIYKSDLFSLKKITLSSILEVEMPPLTVTQLFASDGLTISATNALQLSGKSISLSVGGEDSTTFLLASENTIEIGGTQTTSAVSIIAPLTVSKRAVFSSTDAIKLPVGTTAQRPAEPVVGDSRFNSTTSAFETYNGTAWTSINDFTAMLGGTHYSAKVIAPQLITNGGAGWQSYPIYTGTVDVGYVQAEITIPSYKFTYGNGDADGLMSFKFEVIAKKNGATLEYVIANFDSISINGSPWKQITVGTSGTNYGLTTARQKIVTPSDLDMTDKRIIIRVSAKNVWTNDSTSVDISGGDLIIKPLVITGTPYTTTYISKAQTDSLNDSTGGGESVIAGLTNIFYS
jgi:hypothetical protein